MKIFLCGSHRSEIDVGKNIQWIESNMTKARALLLGTGFVAFVIVIILLIRPQLRRVEITAPKDTQVFSTLPSESEKHLGNLPETPLTLKVKVGATIILRYKKHEQSFPPNKWENGKIVWEPKTAPPIPNPPPNVTVAVNAVPWAEVFIKLPQEKNFIRPQRKHFTIPPDFVSKNSNVTPIRGGLKVPADTTIRLVYGDKEETFGYEAWKTSKTISHDFLNP